MLAAKDISVAGRLGGVSVALRPGEVTAICGPNGAGKSTLLACLAGLLGTGSGSVELGGTLLSALPPRERAQAIGYLPQTPEIAWNIDVRTLAALGRLPWRTGAAADARAVGAALSALDLEALADRPAAHLSGGERARALLARVLAGEPRWLLADEPFANLDLAHQLTLTAHLTALARECAMGVVLVIHDLALAMNHADRVVVLRHGRLAADGPPAAALDAGVIRAVWGVDARWVGESGQKALSVMTV